MTHASLIPTIQDCGSILLAIVCAGLVGWEREQHEKAAGLRTHMLIGVGACLFMIVGKNITPPGSEGQLTRVIQGIATGVGFVGAGSIIRQGSDVKGVTTAAGVWVIAAIGMALGAGSYFIAIFVALINYILIHFLPPLTVQRRRNKKQNEQ